MVNHNLNKNILKKFKVVKLKLPNLLRVARGGDINKVNNEFEEIIEDKIPEFVGDLNFDLNKFQGQPEVARSLIEDALKSTKKQRFLSEDKLSNALKVLKRQETYKNVKQKFSFVVGSVPMFKLLKDISVNKAHGINTMSLTYQTWLGASMVGSVFFHIVESVTPDKFKFFPHACKVVIGIPFVGYTILQDKVTTFVETKAKIDVVPLDLVGTIGTPFDLKHADASEAFKEFESSTGIKLEDIISAYAKAGGKNGYK